MKITTILIIIVIMFVYLLECTDNATYVGATVDVDRRLRQHNKEIKGGAHATGSKVAAGKSWTRVCIWSHVSLGVSSTIRWVGLNPSCLALGFSDGITAKNLASFRFMMFGK